MSSSTLDRSAVINTGPIIALVAARQSLEILPQLYSKLILPRAVWSELMAGGPGYPEIKVVDAQLPQGLAFELANLRHDALHTLDLPNGNSTADEELNLLADAESWVVVTKDEDFVTSHLLKRFPANYGL